FGRWDSVRLDDDERRCVYLAEGLGHGFRALTDSATVTYLCSETYDPDREHTVHPLDADLGITWPPVSPSASADPGQASGAILSDRDRAAPSLAEARAAGALPDYQVCLEYVRSLRTQD